MLKLKAACIKYAGFCFRVLTLFFSDGKSHLMGNNLSVLCLSTGTPQTPLNIAVLVKI